MKKPNKVIIVTIILIILFSVTSCTTPGYYREYKKVCKMNALNTQVGKQSISETFLVNKRVLVLPFIDYRDADGINIAYNKPISLMLAEYFVKYAKNNGMFKSIRVAPKYIHDKYRFGINKKVLSRIKKETKTDIIIWGSIKSMKFSTEDTKQKSMFESYKNMYAVVVEINGDISLSIENGKIITMHTFRKRKTHAIETYVGHSLLNYGALYFCRELTDSGCDLRIADFLSKVIRNEVLYLKRNLYKIVYNKLKRNINAYASFEYPPDIKVISIKTANDLQNQKNIIEGACTLLGALAGVVLVLAPMSDNNGSPGLGGLGIVVAGMSGAVAAGYLMGFLISSLISDEQIKNNLFYADAKNQEFVFRSRIIEERF